MLKNLNFQREFLNYLYLKFFIKNYSYFLKFNLYILKDKIIQYSYFESENEK